MIEHDRDREIQKQLEDLKNLVHDIKLAISGDDKNGIRGIVQRQAGQEKRLKVIEYGGIGVIVILAVTNDVARDVLLKLIK